MTRTKSGNLPSGLGRVVSLVIDEEMNDDWELLNAKTRPQMRWWVVAIGMSVIAAIFAVIITLAIESETNPKIDIVGCTNPAALNFDPEATTDRGCVIKACNADEDCNAPRGNCAETDTGGAQCNCTAGFEGIDCMDLTQQFAGRVAASLSIDGTLTSSDLQQIIILTLNGTVAPDDIIIERFEQQVTTQLGVPIVTNDEVRDDLSQAVAFSLGVPVSSVVVQTSTEIYAEGRRRMQSSFLDVTITSDRDISEQVLNATQFVERVSAEAVHVCGACTSFTPEALSITEPHLQTQFDYSIAPMLDSPELAQSTGESIRDAMVASAKELLPELLSAAGSTLINTDIRDVSVNEAFRRLGSNMFEQFHRLLQKMATERLSTWLSSQPSTTTLDFGGWKLIVNQELSSCLDGSHATGCHVSVTMITPINIGEIFDTVMLSKLPQAVKDCLEPLSTIMIRNMTVTAALDPVVIELAGWVVGQRSETMFRVTADKCTVDCSSTDASGVGRRQLQSSEQDTWSWSAVLNFGDLWAGLQTSLKDSLGNFVNRINVPERASVMISQHEEYDGWSIPYLKVGLMPPLDEVPSVHTLLDFSGGNSRANVVGSIKRNLDQHLQIGIAGTISFKRRTMALAISASEDEGLKLGASLSGAPITLEEAMGSAQQSFNDLFELDLDVMAHISSSKLQPLLQLSVADIRLAMKTRPRTVELSGNIANDAGNAWGLNVSFGLCLNKNETDMPWEWVLYLTLNDRSLLTSGLERYINDADQLEAGALVLISPGSPSVQVGTLPARISADGHSQPLGVLASMELTQSVLDILPDEMSGRRLQGDPQDQNGTWTSMLRLLDDTQTAVQFASSALAAADIPIEYGRALNLAESRIYHVAELLNRFNSGVRGSVQFLGKNISFYASASSASGVMLGAAMDPTDNTLNVGEALTHLAASVHARFTDEPVVSLGGVANRVIQQLQSIEISDFSLEARTHPPTLSLQCTIRHTEFNDYPTILEIHVGREDGTWHWGVVTELGINLQEIAALIIPPNHPIGQYFSLVELGPLVLSMDSKDGLQLGSRIKGGERQFLPSIGGGRRALQDNLWVPNSPKQSKNVTASSFRGEASARQRKAAYGTDTRLDESEISDSGILAVGAATALLTHSAQLSFDSSSRTWHPRNPRE